MSRSIVFFLVADVPKTVVGLALVAPAHVSEVSAVVAQIVFTGKLGALQGSGRDNVFGGHHVVNIRRRVVVLFEASRELPLTWKVAGVKCMHAKFLLEERDDRAFAVPQSVGNRVLILLPAAVTAGSEGTTELLALLEQLGRGGNEEMRRGGEGCSVSVWTILFFKKLEKTVDCRDNLIWWRTQAESRQTQRCVDSCSEETKS